MKKLSVIIPMYNAEESIESCVLSLVNQDLHEDTFEVIIVNDGSHDKSLEIAEKLSSNYSNVRLISQTISGVRHARKTGICHAKGEYIHFINSDETISQNSYRRLFEIISNNHLDILTFNKIENETAVLFPKTSSKRELNLNEIYDGIKFIEQLNCCNTVWWHIIKREFLVSNTFYFIKGLYFDDGVSSFLIIVDSKNKTEKAIDKNKNINSYTSVLNPKILRIKKRAPL